jgi:hypothetical protein
MIRYCARLPLVGPDSPKLIRKEISSHLPQKRLSGSSFDENMLIPQELMAIVPALPSVPIQPLLLQSEAPYGMFEHFSAYPWVLETCRYPDRDFLVQHLSSHVIGPAERYISTKRGAP